MATTATTKPNWSAAVSAVVGAVVSWLLTKWTSIDVGWVALFTLPISYGYHWLISFGEKHFPWLSVFFLALPQNLPTPPVTPPTASTFVETDNGVWAADVNAMEKAKEVAKTPPAANKPKPRSTTKTKR